MLLRKEKAMGTVHAEQDPQSELCLTEKDCAKKMVEQE